MASPLPRAVLWDMDGTLVDSGELHFLAWQEILAGLGRSLDRDGFAATFGLRNDAVLRRLLDPAISDADIALFGNAKEERYRALVHQHGVSALPGAREWLARLAADGWRQAIASSGPRANTQAIIEALQLDGVFAAVIAAEDVTHGKPDPEPFLTAAAQVDTVPARCVVVEDAPPGIESGRRAGMPTIGVLSTHATLDADVIVGALTDLPDDAFDRLVGA
ncbi:MAG: HAD family phosphatase [bacterium]